MIGICIIGSSCLLKYMMYTSTIISSMERYTTPVCDTGGGDVGNNDKEDSHSNGERIQSLNNDRKENTDYTGAYRDENIHARHRHQRASDYNAAISMPKNGGLQPRQHGQDRVSGFAFLIMVDTNRFCLLQRLHNYSGRWFVDEMICIICNYSSSMGRKNFSNKYWMARSATITKQMDTLQECWNIPNVLLRLMLIY